MLVLDRWVSLRTLCHIYTESLLSRLTFREHCATTVVWTFLPSTGAPCKNREQLGAMKVISVSRNVRKTPSLKHPRRILIQRRLLRPRQPEACHIGRSSLHPSPSSQSPMNGYGDQYLFEHPRLWTTLAIRRCSLLGCMLVGLSLWIFCGRCCNNYALASRGAVLGALLVDSS